MTVQINGFASFGADPFLYTPTILYEAIRLAGIDFVDIFCIFLTYY